MTLRSRISKCLFIALCGFSCVAITQVSLAEEGAYSIYLPVGNDVFAVSVEEGDKSELESRLKQIKLARDSSGVSGPINFVFYLPYNIPMDQQAAELREIAQAAEKVGLELHIDVERLPPLKESAGKLLSETKRNVSRFFSRLKNRYRGQEPSESIAELEQTVDQANEDRFKMVSDFETFTNTSTARLFSLVVPPVKIGMAWSLVYLKAGFHPAVFALYLTETIIQGVHGYFGVQANRFKENWPNLLGRGKFVRFLGQWPLANMAFFNFTVFGLAYASLTNVLYYSAGATGDYLNADFWRNAIGVGLLSAVIGSAGGVGGRLLQQRSRISAATHSYALWGLGLLAQLNAFMISAGVEPVVTWAVVAAGSWLPQLAMFAGGKMLGTARQRIVILAPSIQPDHKAIIARYEGIGSAIQNQGITLEELATHFEPLSNKSLADKLLEMRDQFVDKYLLWLRAPCESLTIQQEMERG